MPQSSANGGNIGQAIARHVHNLRRSEAPVRAADRRSLRSRRMQGASLKEVVMLRATMVVLVTALVFGGSALSSRSAFARGRGDGGSAAGGGLRGGHSAGAFGGGRTIGESYRGYGGRVSGLRGG